MINCFSDFCDELLRCGFSLGGGNPHGIYTVIPLGWDEEPLPGSGIEWFTGKPETDPWEWRMRVLEDRRDIAYSKLFFGVSGYISAQWYPLFLSVRRRGVSFDESYSDGAWSREAKRIYDVLREHGAVPMHEIKRLGGFSRAESGRFERAISQLQSQMFITTCGRARRLNRFGESYGWNSSVFTTVESFWSERGVDLALPEPGRAYGEIAARIAELNPAAKPAAIKKFIQGD